MWKLGYSLSLWNHKFTRKKRKFVFFLYQGSKQSTLCKVGESLLVWIHACSGRCYQTLFSVGFSNKEKLILAQNHHIIISIQTFFATITNIFLMNLQVFFLQMFFFSCKFVTLNLEILSFTLANVPLTPLSSFVFSYFYLQWTKYTVLISTLLQIWKKSQEF